MYDRSMDSALAWLHTHQLASGALPVSSRDNRPYPEVTGYCLPTLLRAGHRETAERAAQWLLDCQHSDGYWTGPDGRTPFWFDTAVVSGSLRQVSASLPSSGYRCRRAVARALRWLQHGLHRGVPAVHTGDHDPDAPREINLLGLAMHVDRPGFGTAYDRWVAGLGVARYAGRLQHFYCYVIEAISLVYPSAAYFWAGLFARARALDGSVAAYYAVGPSGRPVPAVSWRCFPATAQWAVLWSRLGYRTAADNAIAFLKSHQTASGGFTGGDGSYFPDEELTWAAKYYIDACLAVRGGVERTYPGNGG